MIACDDAALALFLGLYGWIFIRMVLYESWRREREEKRRNLYRI